ncbi:MAG: hypothetical protein AUI90_09700 [Deltaproteobacteria bacterium 13_1_40CM_3_69_14]|nr:MAG: hypothetical protein AUI90_09700 [Deltaproteobacteria bacterium 13_1_40CM_3_69_14]
MRRSAVLTMLAAIPAISAGAAVPREPFARAHVFWMARAQSGAGEARLAEIDVWAEGTRLRAQVRGEPQVGEFWIDGLASQALHVAGGKVDPPRRKTLEHALQFALAAAPVLPHTNSDRIAGRPCRIVVEPLQAGITMTRCIWRGLPLSVELHDKDFSFHAAAMLVEEGAVALADRQPPAGAPAAPPR